MNREAFYYNEGSISIDNILSPMQNQFMNHTINSSQKGRSNFECQDTSYSPFVVKRNSNIFNSNSSSKSIYNEKSAHNLKVYTPSPNNLKNERLSDRFIPMNKRVNLLEKFELARHCDTNRTLFNDNQQDESEVNETTNQNNKTYSSLLEDNFFNCKDKDTLRGETNDMFSNQKNSNILIKSKILSFRTETKRKSSGLTSLGNMFDNNTIDSATRKISNRPYKIIEAPGLLDDFYLNLLDWSSLNDIAVGLGNSVVLWCANKTQEVKLLSYTGNKYVTSVMWSAAGTELAVGNSEGTIEIWDMNKRKLTRVLEGHTARVGVIAWNGNILSSGSKDFSIINRDTRMGSSLFSKYVGHKQEVCGLKWSFDGTQLASGGNDNKLMVWNLHSDKPMMKTSQHAAAVKAIAWSPHQHNLLASGGGTADRCIRFWNTSTMIQTNYVDTGSQVCNLVFSKTVNELVSTHGYSLNQIITWKLPSMTKLATLTGHTYRVLYLSISPDGQNIVTGAGDQSMRFWNVFPPLKSNDGSSCLFPSNMDVR